MTRVIEKSIQVQLPVEEVWAFLTDTTKLKLWRDQVVFDDRALKVGSDARYLLNTATVVFEEVVEVQHQRRLVFKIADGPHPKADMSAFDAMAFYPSGVGAIVTYMLEPLWGSIKLTMQAEIRTASFWRAVLTFRPTSILHRQLRNRLNEDFYNLERILISQEEPSTTS